MWSSSSASSPPPDSCCSTAIGIPPLFLANGKTTSSVAVATARLSTRSNSPSSRMSNSRAPITTTFTPTLPSTISTGITTTPRVSTLCRLTSSSSSSLHSKKEMFESFLTSSSLPCAHSASSAFQSTTSSSKHLLPFLPPKCDWGFSMAMSSSASFTSSGGSSFPSYCVSSMPFPYASFSESSPRDFRIPLIAHKADLPPPNLFHHSVPSDDEDNLRRFTPQQFDHFTPIDSEYSLQPRQYHYDNRRRNGCFLLRCTDSSSSLSFSSSSSCDTSPYLGYFKPNFHCSSTVSFDRNSVPSKSSFENLKYVSSSLLEEDISDASLSTCVSPSSYYSPPLSSSPSSSVSIPPRSGELDDDDDEKEDEFFSAYTAEEISSISGKQEIIKPDEIMSASYFYAKSMGIMAFLRNLSFRASDPSPPYASLPLPLVSLTQEVSSFNAQLPVSSSSSSSCQGDEKRVLDKERNFWKRGRKREGGNEGDEQCSFSVEGGDRASSSAKRPNHSNNSNRTSRNNPTDSSSNETNSSRKGTRTRCSPMTLNGSKEASSIKTNGICWTSKGSSSLSVSSSLSTSCSMRPTRRSRTKRFLIDSSKCKRASSLFTYPRHSTSSYMDDPPSPSPPSDCPLPPSLPGSSLLKVEEDREKKEDVLISGSATTTSAATVPSRRKTDINFPMRKNLLMEYTEKLTRFEKSKRAVEKWERENNSEELRTALCKVVADSWKLRQIQESDCWKKYIGNSLHDPVKDLNIFLNDLGLEEEDEKDDNDDDIADDEQSRKLEDTTAGKTNARNARSSPGRGGWQFWKSKKKRYSKGMFKPFRCSCLGMKAMCVCLGCVIGLYFSICIGMWFCLRYVWFMK